MGWQSVLLWKLFHTGTLTGSTSSYCVYLNTSGARTISVGTVGPNGLNVSGGTGAGHSVTVANIDNTIAGFSTAQACVILVLVLSLVQQ